MSSRPTARGWTGATRPRTVPTTRSRTSRDGHGMRGARPRDRMARARTTSGECRGCTSGCLGADAEHGWACFRWRGRRTADRVRLHPGRRRDRSHPRYRHHGDDRGLLLSGRLPRRRVGRTSCSAPRCPTVTPSNARSWPEGPSSRRPGASSGMAPSTPETRQSGSRSGRGTLPRQGRRRRRQRNGWRLKEASQLRVSPHDFRVQLRQPPVTDAA